MRAPWPPADRASAPKKTVEIQSPAEMTAAKMPLCLAAESKSKARKELNNSSGKISAHNDQRLGGWRNKRQIFSVRGHDARHSDELTTKQTVLFPALLKRRARNANKSNANAEMDHENAFTCFPLIRQAPLLQRTCESAASGSALLGVTYIFARAFSAIGRCFSTKAAQL
jgi:hypothetical protein